MKFDSLKLKKGALKDVRYGSLLETLETFNGEKGVFNRHEVFAEGQNCFHVITSGSVEKIEPFTEIELLGAKPVIDAVSGYSMTPALNIQAEKIVVKNGGNK